MWNATAQNYGSGGAEHSDGDGLLSILAMAVPRDADGLDNTPIAELQSKSSSVLGRTFNADGRIADFKSAEEVMELMYGPKA